MSAVWHTAQKLGGTAITDRPSEYTKFVCSLGRFLYLSTNHKDF